MARATIITATAALLAAAATGCFPAPGGQCGADADCGYGLTCQDGLCRQRPPRACSPACGAGFHCNDGSCGLDAAPTVAWVSPVDGAFVARGVIGLALSVTTPATDVAVQVVVAPAQPWSTAPPVTVTLLNGGDGAWRALLDASALGEGGWTLKPAIHAGGASWGGAALALRIDRTGPSISLTLPVPAGTAFFRADVIEVRARVSDPGAGVDPDSPVVVAEGMSEIAGTRLGRSEWSFQVPLSAPAFHAAEGPLLLGVRARDRLGNETVQSGAVPVTRLLWRRDVGGGLPVRSSPVVDSKRVYVGTDAARIVALDRLSATPLWSRRLNGPVSASPVRGDSLVYAVSEGGDVRALDPATGEPRWTCVGIPDGLSFRSSPALLAVPGLGAGGAPLEALVVQNSGTFGLADGTSVSGGLFALQGAAGFPVALGQRSCWVLAQVSGGRASPAVAADGAVYAGGDDARGHKLRLLPDATGAYAFREEWSFPMLDALGPSPAISGSGAGNGIAFADDAGHLVRVSDNGAALAPRGESLGEKLLASPVAAFNTLVLLGRDGTLVPFSLVQQGVTAAPAWVQQKIAGASGIEATPAFGADGTLYVSAGRSLRALAPSGEVLWEMALGGAATASSPVIACDGTLYVGDASGALTALATDSRGLAAGWPRFRHDARGTGNAASALCE